MLTRLVQRKALKLPAGSHMNGTIRRPGPTSNPSRFDRLKAYIKREASIIHTTMTTQTPTLPILSLRASKKTMSLSDFAGHTSFVLLMFSYLETDFFQLRVFATTGYALSIIFQYYREKPLWIPIRWNTLFLLINVFMIGLLLKEENDANNIPAEKKALYEGFARKGMNPVDFMLLMTAAKRMDVKKGDVVVAEHLKNTRVYFVASGKLVVMKNGAKIRSIKPQQFTGEMSFIRWEDRMDTGVYEKQRAKKKVQKKWQSKDHETELFMPLLIICEELFKRWGIGAGYSKEAQPPSIFPAPAPLYLSSQPMPSSSFSTPPNALAATPVMQTTASSSNDDSNTEYGAYGISVDAHGNVVSEEENFAPDPNVEQAAPELTVFGRCLNASYDFLFGANTDADTPSTPEPAPQPGTAADGEMAAATVIAVEDCVLYFWSFKRLRILLDQYPSLGRAFERVLSDELNKKMVNTMQAEPAQRYQVLLAAAIMDGQPTEVLKAELAAFRQKYNLTQEDHDAALAQLRWTAREYEAGFKGAPPAHLQQEYERLLAAALANTDLVTLTDEKRTELRLFRTKNGINTQAHVAALRKLGWTIDDYEVGSKNPSMATQKEQRAAAVIERTQRRSRVRAVLFPYLFSEASNQGLPPEAAVASAGPPAVSGSHPARDTVAPRDACSGFGMVDSRAVHAVGAEPLAVSTVSFVGHQHGQERWTELK